MKLFASPTMLATLLALTPAIVLAQETPNAAIESVISGQIEAFQANDLATAFAYASPMIRGVFKTPERFGRMVESGFPMVWRPTNLRFLELRQERGALFQKLSVKDANGRVHILDYEMINTSEGWQVNGVQLVRAPILGA